MVVEYQNDETSTKPKLRHIELRNRKFDEGTIISVDNCSSWCSKSHSIHSRDWPHLRTIQYSNYNYSIAHQYWIINIERNLRLFTTSDLSFEYVHYEDDTGSSDDTQVRSNTMASSSESASFSALTISFFIASTSFSKPSKGSSGRKYPTTDKRIGSS